MAMATDNLAKEISYYCVMHLLGLASTLFFTFEAHNIWTEEE